MVRASAIRPEQAQATCLSISEIFSVAEASISGEETRFSTASRTPSTHLIAMAVDPSYQNDNAELLVKRPEKSFK